MRFVAAAIVLSFPVLDLLATVRFARWTGIPMWIWLAGGLVAGAALLRNERVAFRARTVAAMHGEASILRGMLDSGRKVLAGFLFILPGVRVRPVRAGPADAADQRRARHAPRACVGRIDTRWRTTIDGVSAGSTTGSPRAEPLLHAGRGSSGAPSRRARTPTSSSRGR